MWDGCSNVLKKRLNSLHRQQNISDQFNTGIGKNQNQKQTAVNAYLIKNSKGGGGAWGGGGGHYHKQSEGLGGVLCHSPSQSILQGVHDVYA